MDKFIPNVVKHDLRRFRAQCLITEILVPGGNRMGVETHLLVEPQTQYREALVTVNDPGKSVSERKKMEHVTTASA